MRFVLAAVILAVAAALLPPVWRTVDERMWISTEYRAFPRLPSPRDWADARALGFKWSSRVAAPSPKGEMDPWGSPWRISAATGNPYSCGRDRLDEGGSGDDVAVYPLWSTPYVAWRNSRAFLLSISVSVALSAFIVRIRSFRSAIPSTVAAILLGLGLALFLAKHWPAGLFSELRQFRIMPVRVAAPCTFGAALMLWLLASLRAGASQGGLGRLGGSRSVPREDVPPNASDPPLEQGRA